MVRLKLLAYSTNMAPSLWHRWNCINLPLWVARERHLWCLKWCMVYLRGYDMLSGYMEANLPGVVRKCACSLLPCLECGIDKRREWGYWMGGGNHWKMRETTWVQPKGNNWNGKLNLSNFERRNGLSERGGREMRVASSSNPATAHAGGHFCCI